eukprot:718677-Rhodomonas_salina.5
MRGTDIASRAARVHSRHKSARDSRAGSERNGRNPLSSWARLQQIDTDFGGVPPGRGWGDNRGTYGAISAYAMSGTGTEYGAISACAMSGTDIAESVLASYAYAMSGTDIAYGAVQQTRVRSGF